MYLFHMQKISFYLDLIVNVLSQDLMQNDDDDESELLCEG